MIREQLRARDIYDKKTLEAMSRVPREAFVSEAMKDRAYDDSPLPIGESQTISQPYIVALMTQLLSLSGSEKVLEVGTGSGYQTAVLAEIVDKVFSIERSFNLSQKARAVLESLGYSNVLLRVGDGTVGWDEFSPYDRIIVTAGAPDVPQTLVKQLKEGGILVVPVGDRFQQELKAVMKTESGTKTRSGGGCVFVPLVGREGWSNG